MNDPRSQFDHKFENPFAQNRSRLSQTSGSCTNSYNDHESLQFRPNLHHQESDDSGVCSPPLWKNSPSPPRSPSQPLLNPHRSLSPNSRIQAITRGQRELMEMVKNMPESSYELSLKDLVDNQRIEAQNPQLNNRDLQKVKRQGSKKNERGLMRIESFENKRVFLKMVIPFSLKSKKTKRNSVSSSSGKVSPKPEVGKGGEMEWWKKKFSGSSDSDRSRRSNSSSGRSDGVAGGRGLNGFFTGCWPFLRSKRSKTVE
ncbi:hypothetical protein ACS0TY_035916 [Phlomoides rotata]